MQRLLSGSDDNDELPEIEPEHSVSQVSEHVSKIRTTFSKTLARQIEIDQKHMKLKAIRKRNRDMAKAGATAAAKAKLMLTLNSWLKKQSLKLKKNILRFRNAVHPQRSHVEASVR